MFTAMRYEAGCLFLIDQRQLPSKEVWVEGKTLEQVADAIESMVVRGAPAIGCAAAWGLVVDAWSFFIGQPSALWKNYQMSFSDAVARLAKTRPTAVNLFYALDHMTKSANKFGEMTPMQDACRVLESEARALEEDDVRTCRAIGANGAAMFAQPVSVLTHCNTGSLATAGYGTALGIIRSLNENGCLKSVFVDETRPYLQGSRLTAFELSQEGIPYKLITDSMAAYAMQHGWIDLVVVGADRIAANGDTANKIGTYGLAVLAKHHGVPFVVAAPRATIDTKIATGKSIPVEERPRLEMVEIQGTPIAPANALVWNPSFDVTPNGLISAIVTEDGVHRAPYNFTEGRGN